MYNNSSQYTSAGYHNAYPQYQQGYGGYGYTGYGYDQQNAQATQPTEGFASNSWNTTGYPLQTDPVAQEMQQQRAQLFKQREDYVRKVSVLRHELDQLRIQKQQLVSEGRSTDRDLGNILKENDKLQEEIQGKMKAILNVVEMLSSIIKDGKSVADLEASLMEGSDNSKSPQATMHQLDQSSFHRGQVQENQATPAAKTPGKFCFVHYDTGLHWCRLCDEFPETAKDFLLHLQDKKHMESAKENDVDNTPWHKLPSEEILPSDEAAPKKRVPIKGLQFFISAPSWYCKLCDVWIGDLHCASHHLKSVTHFQNYENFVSQNPHWEMEWLKDREKSMSRKGAQNSSDSDDSKRRKHKNKRQLFENFSLKDKKKKKRSKKKRKHSTDTSSSSSSSDSSSENENTDKSRSIRVAMRNMRQVQSIMEEDLSSKWNVLERLVEEHKKKERDDKEKKEKDNKREDDPLINQWMTVSQPHEKDKRLLESLKDRMRQKQEAEKVKLAELELKRLEKEKAELEMREKKEAEDREAAEQAERERIKREQEEIERIRNKDRDQVKFRTNYRSRRSRSRSDNDENSPHDKYKRERYHKESESSSRSHGSQRSKSRSRSTERREESDRKKPPGPPSYKKLPFIGRMPLFKNKKSMEDKEERKEIKKESYEIPRRTRFQPGNLARAFIPKPDVVCFPKLSSIPPLTIPPPPSTESVKVPDPPKISVEEEPKAPPPPKLDTVEDKQANLSDDEVLYADHGEGINPSMMGQYYQEYGNMMYSQDMYQYAQGQSHEQPPHSFTMPLEPPPLPPDDDLAMLGICADDMAAQSF